MKNLLFLGIIAFLIGCNDEKSSSLPNSQISFSEELSLDFGEVGMSSEIPFSISPLDQKNESFLVFNTFYRRLDTVSFSSKKMRLVPGVEVPKEGPGSIPGFATFSYTEQGILFFTANEFYYFKDGETIKIRMSEVFSDGSKSLKSIYGYDVTNGIFKSASFKGDFISMIVKDSETEKYTLMKYDFETFEEIPFSFDSEQISKHRISFDFAKGSTVSNSFSPYLTVADSVLIVSYPFMNKISKIGLDDLKQVDFLYESMLFKTQKDLPEQKNDFKDLSEFMEINSRWSKDVNYGSVYRLNNGLLYRIVFEAQDESPKKFLELFDNSLKKIIEFDLTAIQSKLKPFYITVEGKILIQSSKDPDEDVFKYYLISVDSAGVN
ncbi:hypothetical protein [Algoriphagus aquimarinus]|uniref:DUF4221 domain-containing protein n=1 Tax=Algoriphagus aquimarinus TaxID=237018 RepID=A0A1I1C549_9BACT|nr:hypothetical protein [Algoriphagus aquimarinus]SFB55920.1 hypothetical protein SAMN04489723_12021 [Algoriphagus aquimarinus]